MNKGVTLFDQLAADHANVAEHADNRTIAYNALGNQYRSLKRLSKAKYALETALAIQEDVVRLEPESIAYQNRLAVILDNLGLVYSDLKYLKPAEATYNRSLTIWERLAADPAAASDSGESRATVHEHLGQLHRTLHRVGLQQTALEEALLFGPSYGRAARQRQVSGGPGPQP